MARASKACTAKRSYAVTKTIMGSSCGCSSASRSKPDSPGIWMWRNTRSGRCSRIASRASRPLLHSPITSTSFAMRRRSCNPRRDSASSSTSSVRSLRAVFMRSARRHFEGQPELDAKARLVVERGETVAVFVQDGQALARIAQPDTATRAWRRTRVETRTVVGHGELEHGAARASFDADGAALFGRRYRVLHGVLDEGLQQQAGHQRFERALLDREFETQAIAESQPLGGHVQVHRLDLLTQGHLLHGVLVERVTQKL